MAVESVDNNAFVQAIIDKTKAEQEAAGKRNTGDLGKDDFLNLLILQLQYQDPLNPTDDTEFIAQMAQFSALEQMQNLNASQTAQKAISMLGKYVYAQTTDESTGATTTTQGHVQNVILSGTQTYVVVDGKEVPIETVYSVEEGYNPLDTSLAGYTGLIGYTVDGAVYDLTTGVVVGVTGVVESLAKGSLEDYAILNGVSVRIAGLNVDGVIQEDRNKLAEYLEAAAQAEGDGRHVEIFVTDANGNQVPIGATLVRYETDSVTGVVTAVLDDVAIPVASVAGIRKATAAASEAEAEAEAAAAEAAEALEALSAASAAAVADLQGLLLAQVAAADEEREEAEEARELAEAALEAAQAASGAAVETASLLGAGVETGSLLDGGAAIGAAAGAASAAGGGLDGALLAALAEATRDGQSQEAAQASAQEAARLAQALAAYGAAGLGVGL
jgi:flagellar basal-body rod modification protein FlgD